MLQYNLIKYNFSINNIYELAYSGVQNNYLLHFSKNYQVFNPYLMIVMPKRSEVLTILAISFTLPRSGFETRSLKVSPPQRFERPWDSSGLSGCLSSDGMPPNKPLACAIIEDISWSDLIPVLFSGSRV